MKEETIEALIDQLNDGSGADHIFVRPLIGSVRFGKAWPILPNGRRTTQDGERFYFIYSEQNECIAAVLDMGAHDLHCFVKAEYRRRGVMSQALKEIILPHLFSNERIEQRVTFYTSETRCLLEKVGFEILDDQNAVIVPKKCMKVDFPILQPLRFEKNRKTALKERISEMAGLLSMVREELDIIGAADLVEEIQFHLEEIISLQNQVEDKWWEMQDPRIRTERSTSYEVCQPQKR